VGPATRLSERRLAAAQWRRWDIGARTFRLDGDKRGRILAFDRTRRGRAETFVFKLTGNARINEARAILQQSHQREISAWHDRHVKSSVQS